MRRFKLTPAAIADLDIIHDRIFAEDPNTAALVLDRIEQTIESVCVFPAMGKETAHPGRWVFGGSSRSPFRITYRFDDETVSVLRVFRAARRDVQV